MSDKRPQCGACGEPIEPDDGCNIRHPAAPNPMHHDCANDWSPPDDWSPKGGGDDIRQQLEDGWPGEWKHPAGAQEWRLKFGEPGLWASITCGPRGCSGGLEITMMPIQQGRVRADTPTEAANALRARAEILVDALERMEDLS